MNATHIPGHGVFIPSELAAFYFRAGLEQLRRNGLAPDRVSPPLRSSLDALRAAQQAALAAAAQPAQPMSAMSADGHLSGQLADIAAVSVSEGVVSTRAMADRLHVTERQARRIATAAGIQPAARNAWHTEDVDRLVTRRRTA